MFLVPRKPAIVKQQLFPGRTTSTFLPLSKLSFKRSFFKTQNPFYRCLFSQLKSPKDVYKARRLHALLVVNGFFHPSNADRTLGSQLVNVYTRFGCIKEALLVFNKLPQKGILAWNAVLRGFVASGEFFKAIEFHNLMINNGVIPDSFTYPLVLKACLGLNDIEQGRKIRALIDEMGSNGLKGNVYVGCALIDMFAKLGSLDEARRVFDEMPVKDVASWGAMICGAALNDKLLQALRLFNDMRKELLEPDSVIVAALVPLCGRMEERNVGMALHGFAVKLGFYCDLFVSNALIDMYCKFGEINDANFLFCSMVYKDVVSWSSLIAGCSQNCLYFESFKLYLEMKNSGVKTNAIITASVLPGLGKLKLLRQGKELHGYVLKYGFENDVVVSSALIDMYSNCGSLTEAKHVFEIMSDRDVMLWNSVIAGYSINGDTGSAFEIFRRIWGSSVRPNYITFLTILPICIRMGILRYGKEIHGYAIRNGLEKFVSIGNSILDMYCKCAHLQLGVNVFDQMVKKNVVTYNTIISAHGVYGHGERALHFFNQMREEGIRPTKVTFSSLLSTCSHSGLLDKGWSIYNSMISDYKILPDMEHYTCMVDLLGRAGQLDEAFQFIRKMPVEPNIDVLGSLLGACRVHKNMELAELVGKNILQKNINDSGYHVLLSNIYASAERWNDALKLRMMIKEKGLVKEPGNSWILVGSNIHKFHARDNMHTESH